VLHIISSVIYKSNILRYNWDEQRLRDQLNVIGTLCLVIRHILPHQYLQVYF